IIGFILIHRILERRFEKKMSPDTVIDAIREELNSIMVELNRTTEQNVQIVEDRMAQLKELVSLADKKIALLKREGEKHEVSKTVYNRIVSRQTQDKTGAVVQDKNVKREVLKLYREGFSPGVIAGHLGTTIGEVELIISLDKRKG
ncbi:MAG TPA: hypothetical protein VMX75_14475, partial [Spirochaetia bacterium]|nr:hypothetical protein [Spirochaetia bacterium]